jgi:hypothetical protein
MLKNAHLLRSPHRSSLQRTCKYASLLRISGALHLSIFEHPGRNHIFDSMLNRLTSSYVNVNAVAGKIEGKKDKKWFSFFFKLGYKER